MAAAEEVEVAVAEEQEAMEAEAAAKAANAVKRRNGMRMRDWDRNYTALVLLLWVADWRTSAAKAKDSPTDFAPLAL